MIGIVDITRRCAKRAVPTFEYLRRAIAYCQVKSDYHLWILSRRVGVYYQPIADVEMRIFNDISRYYANWMTLTQLWYRRPTVVLGFIFINSSNCYKLSFSHISIFNLHHSLCNLYFSSSTLLLQFRFYILQILPFSSIYSSRPSILQLLPISLTNF